MIKNDILRAHVQGWSSDGGGVSRHDGIPIFTPFAAVGDTVELRILKVAKTHAFARVEQVITPSPYRIDNDCPAFGRCGGCDLRHITYEAELEFKRDRVEQALRRIGGIDFTVPSVLPSPAVDGYRNKTIYQIDNTPNGIGLGFYRRHSHDLVECGDCRLQSTGSAQIAVAYRQAAQRLNIADTRWLFYRQNSEGGGMLVIVTPTPADEKLQDCAHLLHVDCPHLDSIMHCQNNAEGNVVLTEKLTVLYGADHISDNLCGYNFEISPRSFYQVNRAQAQNLYQIACDMASGGKHILDLYCGIGTLTLALARNAEHVTGAEIIPQAIADAHKNAVLNGVKNVDFICADAAEVAAWGAAHYDTVVVDPPRKGLSPQAADGIAALTPERIVYVSCDPATQARDIKILCAHGYSLTAVRPVDMFPRTSHVETVALLLRVKDSGKSQLL